MQEISLQVSPEWIISSNEKVIHYYRNAWDKVGSGVKASPAKYKKEHYLNPWEWKCSEQSKCKKTVFLRVSHYKRQNNWEREKR